MLLLLALLAACAPGSGAEGTATVQGSVSDDEGYQAQSFGGSGSVSAASSVRVQAVGPGGSLELLAEADVDVDGNYSVEVPSGQEKLVVEAVDEGGAVVASAILEASGAAGETTSCTPMTTESSLEAQVFVRMVQDAGGPDEVNPIDLRTRITSSTAVAVRDAHDEGEDVSQAIEALAVAALAAQRTEVEAYAELGVETSQAALFDAELAASQSLSAALHAREQNPATAYADLLVALDAVAEDMGATAEERAHAESCAGIAFRASVQARLEADSAASERIRARAILAAAALEARAVGLATQAVLEAGQAGADLQAEAEASVADLRSAITLASTTTVAAAAFAELSVALVGSGDVESSLLGAHLGVNAATALTAEAAVEATVQAGAQLDAALAVIADSALSASGEVDTAAFAEAIVAAYAEYISAVEAAGVALDAAFGSEADTAVDVLILAEGSYRMGG